MLQRALVGLAVGLGALACVPASALGRRTRHWHAHERASAVRFAPNSVWRQRIPSDAAVRADSPSRVARLAAHLDDLAARRFYSSLSYRAYSSPVYVVPLRQPRVRVTLDSSHRALGLVLRRGVPLPSWARPAPGTDAHLTVYQPDSDRLWELWKATRRPDGWHASYGGAMQHVSRSPGYFTSRSWPHLKGAEGYHWGATATSLPVAAGLLTIDDLRRGRADHALAASVPFACDGVFLFPAQRTDGQESGLDCIPEGARLRLDPGIDVTKLGLPRITRIVARAAQQYGLLVRDQTGGRAVAVFAEQVPAGKPDPYVGSHGLFREVPPWATLRHFPWRSLQIMEARACTHAPCRR